MQSFRASNQRMLLQLISKRCEPIFALQRYRRCSSESTNGRSTARDGSSIFTAVMSFGDGSQGALGLPTSVIGIGGDAYEPLRIAGLPSDVRSVSAGHYHSLAVTSRGELWTWGRNDEGQLGRGSSTPRYSWSEPKRVEGLADVKVSTAFASGVISVAIGDDGSLWVWGKSKRGQLGLGEGITQAIVPSRVEALAGEVIAKVSLGWGHALAQTVNGKLYGWGYSADGRLGQLGPTLESSPLDPLPPDTIKGIREHSDDDALGAAEKFVRESMARENNLPIIWEPQLFKEIKSGEVTDIACGLDHSLVLYGDGTLLSGGSNIYGQLGRANVDMGLLPVDIDRISFKPVALASGLGHSMAICKIPSSSSEHNKEFNLQKAVTWGWNRNSQLGRTGSENVPLPVERLKEEETPVSLSGGRVHSLALTSNGNLWVWGCGKNGRLGLGSSFDEPEPMPVDLQGFRVLQAVSGYDHNLLLVAES
ncbi:hypothetical protein Dimus_028420 [Dionaea muscipula]